MGGMQMHEVRKHVARNTVGGAVKNRNDNKDIKDERDSRDGRRPKGR